MAWRVIVIGNPARLSVDNDQLVITQQVSVSLPLEDIAVLVLESQQVTLTGALLARLGAGDILLLACDEAHLPCAALLPFAGHSRLPKQQRLQLDASAPFRKRCWQAVVRRKILNQATCLRLAGRAGADALAALAEEVQSGDTGNMEGIAARRYFRALFGTAFARGMADLRNAALNYGYAIQRAAVARALAAHGFLPAQGIHHCSELNPFNLADDFIEPLRPLVDLHVAGMTLEGDELTREHREGLATLLSYDVSMEEQRHPALYASELMAASFVTACREKNPRALRLPTLLPLQPHRYE